MASQETVLLYRLGSLGDMLVALPALHLVARCFPDARRILLTSKPVAGNAPAAKAVLGDSPLIHDYIDYPVGTRNPAALASLALQLRHTGASKLIYMAGSPDLSRPRRDRLFFRYGCGFRTIIGLPQNLDQCACRPPQPEDPTGLWQTEADRLADCLRPLGEAHPDSFPSRDPGFSPAEIARADSLVQGWSGAERPFLAIAPASKQKIKDWGQENWQQILDGLARSCAPLPPLLFLGAADEAPMAEALLASWPGEGLSLCGKADVRASGVLLGRAALFAGVDSGPMHFAATQGTPCVALFAAHAPKGKWYPWDEGRRQGDPGYRHSVFWPPHDGPITAIDPARVTEALVWQWKQVLEPQPELAGPGRC